MLDCRVPVRKYVLIAKPKRWGQKGGQQLVQSPMLEISSTISQVPVRHFDGEVQNFVCFIPRTDIEKDSSDAYEKSQVSRDTSFVNAHGVALFDSSPSDNFSYKHDDKFWISIGADANGYEECVPVINLRTCESGIIRIDQVCWYPKIRGPGQELWTPGGNAWELKLQGSKKFIYWSFLICQHMDGTPSTIKTVEIPTKDILLVDKSLLSVQESRALFELQQRCILEGPESIRVSLLLLGSDATLLPVPPALPDVEHLRKARNERKKAAKSETTALTLKNLDLWQRIITIAVEGQRRSKGPYILKNSTAHLRQSSHSNEDADDDSNLCGTSQFNTRNSPPSINDKVDEDNLSGPLSLYIIAKDERNEPFISLTDSATVNDPTAAIRKRYIENKPKYNPLFDGLCDQNDPHCHYTTISTQRHYHPPPDKCRSAISAFGNHHTNVYCRPPVHEHCISRTGPYPDRVGNCLLSSSVVRHPNHTCCKWDPADLDTIPFTREDGLRQIKERVEGRIKEAEARRKRIKIHDTRSLCKFKMALVEELGDEELAALGPAGPRFEATLKGFKAELDAGDWDAEVGGLHNIDFDFDDEDVDQIWDN